MKKFIVAVMAVVGLSTGAHAGWEFGGYCGQFSQSSSTGIWTNIVTTATIPANSVGFFITAVDNDGDGNHTNDVQITSSTDAGGEQGWNVDGEAEVDPAAGAAGATVSQSWKHFTSTMSLQAGATFYQRYFNAKIVKGGLCFWMNVEAGVTISSAGTVVRSTSTGDAGAMQMTGLPVSDYLFLRFIASESTSAVISSGSSGWIQTSTSGHNSGTGSSSMGISGEYLIASSTDQSTISDPTMLVTGTVDRVSSLIALTGPVINAPTTSSPTITNATGTMSGNWSTGNILTITGTQLGYRATTKPWIVADFESNRSSPTTLGYKDTWTVVENATTTTSAAFSGSYSLGSTNLSSLSSTIFRVRIDTTTDSVGRGGWWFISWKRRVTYTYVDLNMKWIRLWDSNGTSGSGSQYPNMYWSTQGATRSSRPISLEIQPDSSKLKQVNNEYPHPAQTPGNQWRTDMYAIQVNSSTGAADGKALSYVFLPSSGSYFASSTTWATDSTNAPGLFDQLSPETDLSSGLADGEEWWDDMYADISTTTAFPAMAFLSDEATFVGGNANNNNVNMLVPVTWGPTEATVIINTSGFSAGQTVYLYVRNDLGYYNETGFPLTIAGGSSGGSSGNEEEFYGSSFEDHMTIRGHQLDGISGK